MVEGGKGGEWRRGEWKCGEEGGEWEIRRWRREGGAGGCDSFESGPSTIQAVRQSRINSTVEPVSDSLQRHTEV